MTERHQRSDALHRPVRYRWVVLVIFSLVTCLNCVQWIMFAPIAGTVKHVVGCSGLAVDCLSLIFMASYTLLAIPALRINSLFGTTRGIAQWCSRST